MLKLEWSAGGTWPFAAGLGLAGDDGVSSGYDCTLGRSNRIELDNWPPTQ